MSSSSLGEQTEAESDIDLPTEQEIRIMELATAAAVSSRVNYFDATNWWTIPAPQATSYPGGGLDDHETASLQDQGATPLVQRCMHRYRWTEEYTRRVLHAYQQLLALKAEHRDWGRTWRSTRFLPAGNSAVDRMWQQHVLDTRHYRADCFLLCGGFVEYHPARDDDSLEGQIRIQHTQQALKAKYDASELDLSLWGMEPSNDTAWDDFRSHNGTSKTTATKTTQKDSQRNHGTATTTQTALPSTSHSQNTKTNTFVTTNSSAPTAAVAAAAPHKPIATATPHTKPKPSLGTLHSHNATRNASFATAASIVAPPKPKPPPTRKRKLPLAVKKRRRIDAMHIRQTRVGVGVDAQGTEVVCPACHTKSYKKGHALWCQKSKYFEEHCREQNQQEDAEEEEDTMEAEEEEEEAEAIEEEEEEEGEEETMEENNADEDDGTTTTTQTALLNNNHAALMNSFFAASPAAASVLAAAAPCRPKSPPAIEQKQPATKSKKKKYRRRIDNLHIREIRMGFGMDEHGREVVCPACHSKSYKKGHAHWCQKSTYVSEHNRQFLEEAVGNPA